MKRLVLTALMVCIGWYCALAQQLVTTGEAPAHFMLEEYTGMYCPNCPKGHAVAEELQEDYGRRFHIMNIHAGGYANPGPGQPDFRTAFGEDLATNAQISGYPNGTLNRHYFKNYSVNQTNEAIAMSYGQWPDAVKQYEPRIAPVNVGCATDFNAATHELEVTVELYYTDDVPVDTNFLNIAILESNIIAFQASCGDDYNHKHVLRDLITGLWGESVVEPAQGTFITRSFTYTVSDNWVAENCHVQVFVTEERGKESYNVCEVPLINGTTKQPVVVNLPEQLAFQAEPSTTHWFNCSVENRFNGEDNFSFDLTSTMPDDWNASLVVDGEELGSQGEFVCFHDVPANVRVKVEVGSVAGIASLNLALQSQNVPNATDVQAGFMVLSGVTDLVVNNYGEWGEGTTCASLEQDYFDGLEAAGITSYASLPVKTYNRLFQNSDFPVVQNIYYNVAHTTRSFTNKSSTLFMKHMQRGGNFFVAGHRIGFDTWDGTGTGTLATRYFYTNYLGAEWNSQINNDIPGVQGMENDAWFSGVNSDPLQEIFPYSSVEKLLPGENSMGILQYNEDLSVAGIRHTDGCYKAVYLGFDPSMIADDTQRNALFLAVVNYFHNMATVQVLQQPSCSGSCNGSAKVVLNGAVEPVNIVWDDENQTNGELVQNLCPGEYTATITDANNQVYIRKVTMEEPDELEVSFLITHASCFDCNDGAVEAVVLGGSGDYTLLWDDPNQTGTNQLLNISAGDYTLQVTDNVCGQSVTLSATVQFPNGVEEGMSAELLSVMPNPASDVIHIDVPVEGGVMEIVDIQGSKIYYNDNFYKCCFVDVQQFPRGLYLMRYYAGDRVWCRKILVVHQ